MESLKKKSIRGISWSLADNIANAGITFLIGLILARILSPDDFGIIGIITIIISFSNTLIDSGISSALIRKLKISETDLNTAFFFNLILSVILYSTLYILSDSVARFFQIFELGPLTRWMGLVIIINAFGIVHKTILVSNVDFKTQTKISLIASTLSGFLAVLMALSGYHVWSLVVQQLLRQFLISILLWLNNSWRPSWQFSFASFTELFAFGYKLLLSGLIDMIYRNSFNVIIGKFYSAQQLGFYTRADQFNQIFSSNLTSVVQKVSYPVLSKIQDDDVRLKYAYQRIIKTTMLVAFACMFGLAAIAKPLIILLIGVKWLTAADYLQILCFAGALYPIHAINLNILLVKGRSDLFLKLEIMKKMVAILPIFCGIFFGIESMLLAAVLVSLISFVLNSYYSNKLIGYSTLSQIRDVSTSFLVSLFTAAVVWGVSLLSLSTFLTLFLQCVIGVFLGVFFYELLKNQEYLELKNLLLMNVQRLFTGFTRN